jgi:hypothetical protein
LGLVTQTMYFTLGGLFTWVDLTAPNFLSKYKIQPGINQPVDFDKFKKLMKNVVFNATVTSILFLHLVYAALRDNLLICL